MLERIAEITRTRHLVGCSAMGIVTSDGEVEDEPPSRCSRSPPTR
jgi:small ligand-binding sensory domain FIST